MAPTRTSSSIADGEVLIKVTDSLFDRLTSFKALRASRSVPPLASVTNISKNDTSKQMEVDANIPPRSLRLYTSLDHCTSITGLLSLFMTSLELHVEQEL